MAEVLTNQSMKENLKHARDTNPYSVRLTHVTIDGKESLKCTIYYLTVCVKNPKSA